MIEERAEIREKSQLKGKAGEREIQRAGAAFVSGLAYQENVSLPVFLLSQSSEFCIAADRVILWSRCCL